MFPVWLLQHQKKINIQGWRQRVIPKKMPVTMSNWRHDEICELLLVRTYFKIVKKIQERARDSVVYDQITNWLPDPVMYWLPHALPSCPCLNLPERFQLMQTPPIGKITCLPHVWKDKPGQCLKNHFFPTHIISFSFLSDYHGRKPPASR